MRFIQDLSSETLPLLQKIYKKSKYHRVRQRAHCLLLSSQGYTIKELSHIFNVDRITIYNWFNSWESRRLAGLYVYRSTVFWTHSARKLCCFSQQTALLMANLSRRP